jgi:hypothetical protein
MLYIVGSRSSVFPFNFFLGIPAIYTMLIVVFIKGPQFLTLFFLKLICFSYACSFLVKLKLAVPNNR